MKRIRTPAERHQEYLRNKESWNRASKKWYQKNKVEVLEKLKKDREDRPEFHRERKRKWYEKNKETILAYHRKRQSEIRDEIVGSLGGRCCICGEINRKWLHLDRIKGGPHDRTADWIKKHIKEFQVLCANHHNEKTCYKEIHWKGKVYVF